MNPNTVKGAAKTEDIFRAKITTQRKVQKIPSVSVTKEIFFGVRFFGLHGIVRQKNSSVSFW